MYKIEERFTNTGLKVHCSHWKKSLALAHEVECVSAPSIVLPAKEVYVGSCLEVTDGDDNGI